jgi:DNA polymerase (family X)
MDGEAGLVSCQLEIAAISYKLIGRRSLFRLLTAKWALQNGQRIMKDRFEIAADLRTIAGLLKLKGENPFKAQAYERGAAALEKLDNDLGDLVKARRLQQIPGVGSALAAIIEEIYLTDECRLLEQLRSSLPPGAAELCAIPGLSLKKIAALHEALEIASIAALKIACEQGQVAKVKGFGVKSQAKLLADL